jgi:UPF0755 protein
MPKLLKLFAFFISLLLVVSIGTIYTAYNAYISRGPLEKNLIFEISSGQSFASIADQLEKKNIINNQLLIRIFAKATGFDTQIKAGEYEVDAYISMSELLELFVSGKAYQRSFTISEGLTSWQIVDLLNNIEGLSGTITDIPAEGTLLPETYFFQKGDIREKKLEQMKKALEQTLDKLLSEYKNERVKLSRDEIIILASIVEKETGMHSEREKIAGVFFNRLEKGMKLQTDPTVIYALTKGKIKNDGFGPLGRRLLKKDLEYDSPYNTYKYSGLPPGPIANPGIESIKAVLNPEQHEYLYFVANGKGGHTFAKTLQGHNKNVSQWRKIRKSKESKSK